MKCPNCETVEMREIKTEDSSRNPREIHACPECPMVCFDFWSEEDIGTLCKLLKTNPYASL